MKFSGGARRVEYAPMPTRVNRTIGGEHEIRGRRLGIGDRGPTLDNATKEEPA